jgi:hypothetical protein
MAIDPEIQERPDRPGRKVFILLLLAGGFIGAVSGWFTADTGVTYYTRAVVLVALDGDGSPSQLPDPLRILERAGHARGDSASVTFLGWDGPPPGTQAYIRCEGASSAEVAAASQAVMDATLAVCRELGFESARVISRPMLMSPFEPPDAKSRRGSAAILGFIVGVGLATVLGVIVVFLRRPGGRSGQG